MNVEEEIKNIKMSILNLTYLLCENTKILRKLVDFVIPEKKDYSTQSATAQELVKKGKPPRKQPKKKAIIMDGNNNILN